MDIPSTTTTTRRAILGGAFALAAGASLLAATPATAQDRFGRTVACLKYKIANGDRAQCEFDASRRRTAEYERRAEVAGKRITKGEARITEGEARITKGEARITKGEARIAAAKDTYRVADQAHDKEDHCRAAVVSARSENRIAKEDVWKLTGGPDKPPSEFGWCKLKESLKL